MNVLVREYAEQVFGKHCQKIRCMWQKEPQECCSNTRVKETLSPCARSTSAIVLNDIEQLLSYMPAMTENIQHTARDDIVVFYSLTREGSTPSSPTQLMQTPLAFLHNLTVV